MCQMSHSQGGRETIAAMPAGYLLPNVKLTMDYVQPLPSASRSLFPHIWLPPPRWLPLEIEVS